mgnify:CR=1 FL=1
MTSWRFGGPAAPCLIAGPCVVEELDLLLRVADRLAELGRSLSIPVCFKASFDKANRARVDAARGPGLDRGLEALAKVKAASGLPVLTDVHESHQAAPVAEVVDVLQVPAFLSRQTDLLVACGRTGKPVNIKKGQWLDPGALEGAVAKVRHGGATEIAVTERGTFFGYGALVVDMRSFERMKAATGVPVIFDATHSVQRPGRGSGGASGGDRAAIPGLLLAAAVAGADGFFLETHPDPARAASDADTQWPLDQLDALIRRAVDVWQRVRA